MSVQIINGNALDLPLGDNSVDLVVTSPPYFGLRSYQDGGEHYDGQIGAEPTPADFVDALIAATREMVRVVKPSGSIFVNLGDKYSGGNNTRRGTHSGDASDPTMAQNGRVAGLPPKTLVGIPWRYAIRCIDDLGLILRAEVIWSKPNGLPESVTDRVRRSHEQWFHFTLEPHYYSAVDEIREQYHEFRAGGVANGTAKIAAARKSVGLDYGGERPAQNPLGKLPGSVWTIPTEPLHVPDDLGIDHFAAFPTEWPRRIIQGWSPRGICVECGAGRRPVISSTRCVDGVPREDLGARKVGGYQTEPSGIGNWRVTTERTLMGEACACPEPTAPTRPGVILDPFGGTGTTALVADVLGRHGISVDMSRDYCRLAEWRTTDPKQRAKAACREYKPAAEQTPGQLDLLEGIA